MPTRQASTNSRCIGALGYTFVRNTMHDELYYTHPVAPQDAVRGDEFPGETFRVLKDKDIQQYGYYLTRRSAERGEVYENGSKMILA